MRFARYAALACLLPGLVGLLGIQPAATAVPAQAAMSSIAAAKAPRLTAAITFEKNYRNPFRSELVWRVWEHRGKDRKLVERKSWRAGSGFTKKSTNACKKNDGWLPNGRYRPRLHANYWGNLIKGRAIFLGQKKCHNGTVRTDLFIHTEQGDHNRQCPDRKGDQVCRWEYPKFNDYRSLGCVKLSPHDMRALFRAWRKHFDLGYDGRVRVRVVN